MSALIDSYGRLIKDLRISITPRCNYKCSYCDPLGIIQKDPIGTVSVADIDNVLAAAVELGIESIRFTGGEPLLRQELPEMIHIAKQVYGIKDVAITSNASLLKRRLADLITAGLDRVNISFDAADPEVFRRITKGGNIKQVWQAIEAVQAAGLQPVKLNAVIMKDINDSEILGLAELSRELPYHIRFIEYMHLNNSDSESYFKNFVAGKDIKAKIEAEFGELTALDTDPSAPARLFKVANWAGAIGFINPVSEPFCGACSRMRLTSDAKLRPCLLTDREISVREALDSEKPVEAMIEMFLLAAHRKVKSGITSPIDRPRTMVSIGG